jgi:hypothetical protein
VFKLQSFYQIYKNIWNEIVSAADVIFDPILNSFLIQFESKALTYQIKGFTLFKIALILTNPFKDGTLTLPQKFKRKSYSAQSMSAKK